MLYDRINLFQRGWRVLFTRHAPSDTLISLWQSFPLPQTLFVRFRHKNYEVFRNHRLHLVSRDTNPTLRGGGPVCEPPLNPGLCPPCWVFSLPVLRQAVQFPYILGLHLSSFKAWYILYRHWRVPSMSVWNMRDASKRQCLTPGEWDQAATCR